MKKFIFSAIAIVCAVAVISCSSNGITKGGMKLDSLSYCLGANIGFGVSAQMNEFDFNYDVVEEALEKAALGKSKMTQDESLITLRDYFGNRVIERRNKNQEIAADSTKTDADLVPMFASQEERDSVSYAFGNDIGCNLAASKLPLQTKWIKKGLEDGRNHVDECDEMKVNEYLQYYFTVVRPAELAKKGEAWLAKMEKKSGVQKTESGLLYKVVKEGDMSKAAVRDEDEVKVNYEGKTSEGKVFDSSYERGEPISFPLNRVIKGWTEGMKLVGEGGEIILYIPAELAYGSQGAGRDIGPNEPLEFRVELLEVIPHAPEAEVEVEAPVAE